MESRKKRKIMFVHHVSYIGGASYCLLNIVKELDKTQYDVIVMLKEYGPLVEELKSCNVSVEYCKSLCIYPYFKSLLNIRSLVDIIKVFKSRNDFNGKLKAIRPDLVYFNNTFLFPYLTIAKSNNIKSIIHIREHWPLDLRKRQLSYIQSQIQSNADSIIAINDYCAKMVASKGDKKDPTIVYDWIEMDKRYEYLPINSFMNEECSISKVFLYTGGLSKIKGALEVIKAFNENRKDPNDRLLALGLDKIGNGNKLKSKVKRFLYKLGYSTYEYKIKDILEKDSRIVCRPMIYNLKHIIEQCYCNLSYFTFPHANLALAECITLGVPSLAASTVESKEYSLNGKLCILHKINNYEEFAANLRDIDLKYDNIKYNLDADSNMIKTKFDKSENFRKLSRVLNSLICYS